MRIEVVGTDDSATPQTRAYAEYRLFATLARHLPVIRSVRVMLAHAKRNGGAEPVTCLVELVLEPPGSVRTCALGPHPYGAIDRAAERIGDLMARRTIESTSS